MDADRQRESGEVERDDPALTHAPATPAHPVLRLQRAVGNRAVSALLSPPPTSDMEVGAADDPAERAADAVAASVVHRLADPTPPSDPGDPPQSGATSRVTGQPLFRVAAPRGLEVGAEGGAVSEQTAADVGRKQGRGKPLDSGTRGAMEGAFGADLGHVRVHTDGEADDLSRRIGARAFTTGSDIFFRRGEFRPSTAKGQHTLAHELAHVVQEGGGPRTRRLHRLADGVTFRERTKKLTVSGGFLGLGKKYDPAFESVAVDLDGLDAKDKQKRLGQLKRLLTKVHGYKDPKAKPKDDKKKKGGKADDAPVATDREKAMAALLGELQSEIREVEAALAPPPKVPDQPGKKKKKKAKAPPLVQSPPPPPVPDPTKDDHLYKTYAEIKALKLSELRDYTTTTPKWHERSTLSDADRGAVRAVLAYTDMVGSISSLDDPAVDALLAVPGKDVPTTIVALTAYTKAVSGADPFRLDPAANVQGAVRLGETIATLQTGFPDWVLEAAMDSNSLYALAISGYVQDVVDYYTKATQPPYFQATNGNDFNSYIALRNEAVDPLVLDKGVLSGRIRNFHRFEGAALKQLVANFGDKSRKKPLAIVLHSAIDHNHAFHRDPYLTELVQNANINALVIEGGATLADYKSPIAGLAADYGVGGKIDQVMFAGHGNSRLIEMAGTVTKSKTTGKLQEGGEPINLDGKDKAAADDFFAEIMAHMGVKPSGPSAPGPKNENLRIIFNACLTNSNAINEGLVNGKDAAKLQIIDYLSKNASLATYMQTFAQKTNPDVESTGANASIGQVHLVHPGGKLDLASDVDPAVTAKKIEYVEFGIEPEGAMHAVIECWATDETKTLEAMERRKNTLGYGWQDVIIFMMYDLCIINKDKPGILGWANAWSFLAGMLSHLENLADCRVDKVPKDFAAFPGAGLIMEGMLTHATLAKSSAPHRLVLNQLLWAYAGTDKADAIRADLATMDAASAQDYLDLTILNAEGKVADLYKTGSAEGRAVAALIGTLAKTPDAKSVAYLKTLMHAGAPKVDGLDKVDPVAKVDPQPAPRGPVAEVAAVKGRDKVEKIDGKRAEFAKIDDLPKLDKLDAVPAPKKGEKAVTAPGRVGRPGRAKVEPVPEVAPFFEPTHKIKALAGARATEEDILAILKKI